MAGTLRLGAPFWSFSDWVGGLYSADARPGDFLRQYAGVFDTVEGNTTFYRVPTPDTVARWRDQVPTSFRFCFKLPRSITHDAHLEGVEAETDRFLERLEPLADRLGPTWIQLPPSFAPSRLERLQRFVERLPADRPFAVEFRHPGWFDDGRCEHDVDAWLGERGIERIEFDSRALRRGPGAGPEVAEARRRKPDLPARGRALGPSPVIRFVGHEDFEISRPDLEAWADRLAGWLEEGRSPYFFLHTPSNRPTPDWLRWLHERIAARVELPALPTFAGERGESAAGQLPLL